MSTSKVVTDFLLKNPLLTKYAQMNLVNITSLAHFIKETKESQGTIASLSMSIRRYLAQLPKYKTKSSDSLTISFNLVSRSNLSEFIFNKTKEKRQLSQDLFQIISKTKNFSCLIEGEKEIVLLTDYPLEGLPRIEFLKKMISHHTQKLGFISIDLPIKLREVIGVYSRITSALAIAQIPIHSFHTIGGEVLILVKNEDLIKTQEVISSSLL
ncbi:MAG: ACT domain-containing protein [bacterium]|nr:ACT domain-containing protein [bacterium]